MKIFVKIYTILYVVSVVTYYGTVRYGILAHQRVKECHTILYVFCVVTYRNEPYWDNLR